MSPSWADRIRAGFAPGGVALLRRGPFGRRLRGQAERACAASGLEQPDWAPALEALHALLGEAAWRHGRVTVVLSDHFLHTLTVPWDAALLRHDEQEAMVRHAFAQAYGEAAAGWALRWQTAALPAPCLATATDPALLDALQKACRAPGRCLVSLQPHLMARCNAVRRGLPRQGDAWLVLEDEGRLLICWLHAGSVHACHSHGVNGDWPADLPAILERSMLLAGPDAAPGPVFIDLPAEQGRRVALAPGWRLIHLPAAAVPGRGPAGARYALAGD